MPCAACSTPVSKPSARVLTLADTLAPDDAKAEVERIASGVLANPVIEDYTFRIE